MRSRYEESGLMPGGNLADCEGVGAGGGYDMGDGRVDKVEDCMEDAAVDSTSLAFFLRPAIFAAYASLRASGEERPSLWWQWTD